VHSEGIACYPALFGAVRVRGRGGAVYQVMRSSYALLVVEERTRIQYRLVCTQEQAGPVEVGEVFMYT